MKTSEPRSLPSRLQWLTAFLMFSLAGIAGAAQELQANFTASIEQTSYPKNVTFVNQSLGGPTSVLWDFGDGETSTKWSPSHLYVKPGNFDVTLTITRGSLSDSFTRVGFVAPNCIPCRAPSSLDVGCTIQSTIPLDERLRRPKNRIAADIGLWGLETTIVERMHIGNPSGSGNLGVFYEDCFGFKLWHVQHIVRLANKNGDAYFAMTGSNSGFRGDATREGGYLAIFKVDREYVDPETDLILPGAPYGEPDYPTQVGRFVTQRKFGRHDRAEWLAEEGQTAEGCSMGAWNHPGKMELIGGVLVIAMEDWFSSSDPVGACGDYGLSGTLDSLAFFDVRDPEHPILLANLPVFGHSSIVNQVGVLSLRHRDEYIISAPGFTPDTPLDLAGTRPTRSQWRADQLLPLISGRHFRPYGVGAGAIPETLWEPLSVDAYGFSGQHGMNFVSYQLRSVTDATVENLIEKSYFHQPLLVDDDGVIQSSKLNFIELEYPPEGTAPSEFAITFGDSDQPRVPLTSLGAWVRDWECSSVYVTPTGMPVVYSMENAQHNFTGSGADGVLLQAYDPQNLDLAIPHPERVVTNTNDHGPGSLRNAMSYGGRITFADDFPDDATIELTTGPLVAYIYDVEIDGSTARGRLTIDGGNEARVFEVAEGRTATLSQLKLTGGRALEGGAIRNIGGYLTLIDCEIVGNGATRNGGAILNGALELDSGHLAIGAGQGGSLHLIKCKITNNGTSGSGGAICNIGGSVLVERTLIRENVSAGPGSAIFNLPGYLSGYIARVGDVTLNNCTVANNSGGGAALHNEIAFPSSFPGGGTQRLVLNHCTVVYNETHSPTAFAGVYNGGSIDEFFPDPTELEGWVELSGNIIAHNTRSGAPADLGGDYVAPTSNNIFPSEIQQPSLGSVTPLRSDPQLNGPGDFASDSIVFLPKPHSPVIDVMPPGLPGDQRSGPYFSSVSRPTSPAGVGTGLSDLGSVEVVPLSLALGSPTATVAGPGGFFGQRARTFGGPVAAQSWPTLANGSSSIEIQVGPGELAFTWNVSSAEGDRFEFLLDGVVHPEVAPLSGTGGPPRHETVMIPAGMHTATWRYVKDTFVVAGIDAGWVGDVVLRPQSTVTNTGDRGPGSLREVIAGATSGSEIRFDAALSGQTIQISSPLTISKSLTIDGVALEEAVVIDGGGGTRLFEVSSSVGSVMLRNLTLQNGFAGGADGGGAILNHSGSLTIEACTLRDCLSVTNGGAIVSSRFCVVRRSTLASNVASENGGAVWVAENGYVILQHSTITDNTADRGGAVFVAGGDVNRSDVRFDYCTVAANRAHSEGGGLLLSGYGNANLTHTILASNTPGPDILNQSLDSAPIGGYQLANMIGNNETVEYFFPAEGFAYSHLTGTPGQPLDPGLLPLGDYGGPTHTMPARADSLAIDQANAAYDPSNNFEDQRGLPRPYGLDSDLGAVESRSGLVTNLADAGEGSLRQVVADAPSGARIEFQSDLSDGTLALSSGQILIDKNLNIDARSLSSLTISGSDQSRIFEVAPAAEVTLWRLRIEEGSAPEGGGILNRGVLTLLECSVDGCSATDGGAIANRNGVLTLVRSTVSNSTATISGGGIRSLGELVLENTTVSGNHSVFSGGGVAAIGGQSHIRFSTIAANTGGRGGGVYFVGILGEDLLGLQGSLVAANQSPEGDDIRYQPSAGLGIVDNGSNLIGSNETVEAIFSAGPYVGTSSAPLDPGVLPLGYWGGPTRSMRLSVDSPALDAGGEVADVLTDQRGDVRSYGVGVDIGAYELQEGIVKTTLDEGVGSLRGTIAALPPGGTVGFRTDLGGPILVSAGEIRLNKDMVLNGRQVGGVTISGGSSSRVFNVTSQAEVRLRQIEVTRGAGSAITNAGVLRLEESSVTNSTGSSGGGILNFGSLWIVDSTISGNVAVDFGGGISSRNGIVLISNSTVAGNHAGFAGGGVHLYNTETGLRHTTIADNTAPRVGGVMFEGIEVYFEIVNSIVAGNVAGIEWNDIWKHALQSIATSNSNNLIGDNSTVSDIFPRSALAGTAENPLDPRLAPLGAYGGATRTMRPLNGSPALDAGRYVVGASSIDQRGFQRYESLSDAFDLGSVEVGSPVLLTSEFVAPGSATVTVRNATPGGEVQIGVSMTGPGPIPLPEGDLLLSLPILALPMQVADSQGVASFTGPLPSQLAGTTVWLHAYDVEGRWFTNGVEVPIGSGN